MNDNNEPDYFKELEYYNQLCELEVQYLSPNTI